MTYYIPTRADARSDPGHRLWFAYTDALEALQRDPCVDRVKEVDAAWREFFEDYTKPASQPRKEVSR